MILPIILERSIMYAIIEAKGKQYRVQEGDVLHIDLAASEQKTLQFDKVLFFHDGKGPHVGAPHVAKCVVHAELLGDAKGPKVIAFKYKKCKNYRRTVGHRQKYFPL